MPANALTDAELMETIALLAQHGGSASIASRATGIPKSTLESRQKSAAARGLLGFDPVLPGFQVQQTSAKVDGAWVKQVKESGPEFVVPEGHVLKGVSALVDMDNRVRQTWIKTKTGEIDLPKAIDILKSAFQDYEGRGGIAPLPERPTQSKLFTLIPCNDWHVNMLAWGQEVGTTCSMQMITRTGRSALATSWTSTVAMKRASRSLSG